MQHDVMESGASKVACDNSSELIRSVSFSSSDSMQISLYIMRARRLLPPELI